MNRICFSLFALLLLPVLRADEPNVPAAVLDNAHAEAGSVQLNLTSVTLHAAGKGWFEYSGTIEGSGKFAVDVGTFEVDEAIRVSRLIDPAGAGEIRLAAANDPIQPTPLAPDTRTLGNLLLSMKGQPIVAEMRDGKSIPGRLVAIEQRTDRVDDVSEDREYMTVLTSEGLQKLLVEDTTAIRSTDAAFQARLEAALSSVARTHELPTSQIEFVFPKGEKRQVTVGVMRRVPRWKIGYRIEDDKLIHRSIVDNTSGTDWSDVDLRLVDGNPVLFAMDMHSVARARFSRLDRPEGHVAMAPSFNESLSRDDSAENRDLLVSPDMDGEGNDAADAAFMESEMMMGMGGFGGGFGGGMGGGGAFGGGPPRRTQTKRDETGLDPTAAMNHALAQTQDAPAGSTLALNFEGVDLPSGETALLDTVVSPISIADVSVYRETYHPTATLLCVEIENNTPSLLPSGPLTVLAGDHQRSILGELVLPALGPQSKRLAGYAIDGGVRVTVKPTSTKAVVQAITLDRDQHDIEIETLHERSTDYEFLNRSGESRTVVLESAAPTSPFQWAHGSEEGTTYEQADQFNRERFSLGDGESETRTVLHQHSATESKEWGAIAVTQLEAWINDSRWGAELKSSLQGILESRRGLDQTNEQLASLLALRGQLIQEIERVTTQLTRRYNGASLPKEVVAQYQDRLIALEHRREKSELRMRELEAIRRTWTASLGMPPQLPDELLPLRAFIVDTDLLPAGTADGISPGDDSEERAPAITPDPFGGGSSEDDPFSPR
ncbi:hypothetical protein [Allorhodopirellula heiligendammensis]|uniref:DUF4139 domain-containing protein n=1 Tax=Allorhodopirellula heiligendammensis TaxID=2714739 RepID=A0A5C6C7V9_9BACT|nr:hypothetical protein [Allorhodopirellula heiligendammensis]TWU18839.1 hypothetical protein Poly21_10050 [Allorhodopirellula heiligendammensis]